VLAKADIAIPGASVGSTDRNLLRFAALGIRYAKGPDRSIAARPGLPVKVESGRWVRDWRRPSRHCPDPRSDLARLGLAADWTRPSLERNPIANCWRVQINNAGAAKEQHYAGVVVRLDDTASCFRAIDFNLTYFCHKSLLSVCGAGAV
jgi:hypothetical protein